MVRELTVTPAGQQPVTIVYRIDNRRGKRVGATQHSEPVAAAHAAKLRRLPPDARSVVDSHPHKTASHDRVQVSYCLAAIP